MTRPAKESRPKDKPLLRSIGEFLGEVWKGVKTDPSRVVTRRTVEEREAPTPGGKVVLRRTTVEEIVLPPKGE